jgi:hypothetical protein
MKKAELTQRLSNEQKLKKNIVCDFSIVVRSKETGESLDAGWMSFASAAEAT